MNDFKRRIDTQMSESEIKNMTEDGKISTVLKTQLVCEDEIDTIQKQVSKQLQEMSSLAKSNQEIKQKMLSDYNAYQSKLGLYEDL